MAMKCEGDDSTSNLQKLHKALETGLQVVAERWRYPTGDWVSGIDAADIDSDNDVEVLVGSRDGNTYVLSKRGGLKWKFGGSDGWNGTVFGIESNEMVRVLVGSRDHGVYALDERGQILWKYDIGNVPRQVLAYDINRDGHLEVIVGSEDRCIHVLEGSTGRILWHYQTNGWIRTVCVADIDGDGMDEILAGSGDKHLYVLDHRGHLKWKHNTSSKIHTVLALDIDKDGIVEILLGSDAKNICALTADQQVKWQFPVENRILSIAVADLDNDGRLEIIAGSEDKHLYILNDHGKLLWKHFLGSRVFSVHATDLKRDHFPDVLVGTEYNCIQVLQIRLQPDLLQSILTYYHALGSPPPITLDISPAATILLQDLVEDCRTFPQELELDLTTERAQKIADPFHALSAALKSAQRRARLLWCKEVGHVRAVCLRDINADGVVEIVVGTDHGDIRVLDKLGHTLWSRAVGDRVWAVQVDDVDGDGEMEVIAGNADNRIYVLSSKDGSIKQTSGQGSWARSICIPVRGNAEPLEVFVGLEDKKIYVWSESFRQIVTSIDYLHCVRAIYSHDINNDDQREIIAGGSDNAVCAYTKDGLLLWKYRIGDHVRSVQVKDIDADGLPEIIAGSEDRNVYVLNHVGHLKWRYHAPHRILDIDTINANQGGKCDILLGAGDGCMYVLSADGDLIWSYKVGDRIRALRGRDLDDGTSEIVVGSEDRKLYVLQVLKQQQYSQMIEESWLELELSFSLQQLLFDLAQRPEPLLRGFVVTKLANHLEILNENIDLLQMLAKDASPLVRTTFARNIAQFYRTRPDETRHFLDILSTDDEKEVRIAFVDSLPALTHIDIHVGLEYFDRSTRDQDMWVRRNVVRKLDQLISTLPHHGFRLLLVTAQDESTWIRHESSRILAHYLALHEDRLIISLRQLVSNNIDVSVIQWIAQLSPLATVSRLCLTFSDLLLGDLSEQNIVTRLFKIVQALQGVRNLSYGKEAWKAYGEIYHLHTMQTIHEIAQYRYQLKSVLFDAPMRFDNILQVLQRLTTIVVALETYLRREGLGDRLASLLEAIARIEELYIDLERIYFWANGEENGKRSRFPDQLIMELLLKKWRGIVTAELALLRGRAEVRPELRTKQAAYEQQVGVWLSVSNSGRSPADNVTVQLRSSSDFKIIGSDQLVFETIPAQGTIVAEFTIEPAIFLPHLIFEIAYDDAETKGKSYAFGDRLELQERKASFLRIPNPYSAGPPVHTSEMFYGRKSDLDYLKNNLTVTSTNMVIVLYGQRRSGKSSLLNQLTNTSVLDPHIPVYVDMQQEALGITTSRFFYKIAYYIYKALIRRGMSINQPLQEEFNGDPTLAFDLFLDRMDAVLKHMKVVLLIDEFEVLEQKVVEKALPSEIFLYLRSLMQHRPNINFLLTGTHTIESLTKDYWSVFFNIARHYRLPRLSQQAAVELITKPTRKFLEYDTFAVEKIRQLTADQPFLIQLFCHSLVEHCNSLQKNYVTINDVNTVMSVVMETGQVHFTWIWDQSTTEEHIILSSIAQEGGDEGRFVSLADIERVYRHYDLRYNSARVMQVLKGLVEKEIIVEGLENSQWKIAVGLICEWLRKEKLVKQALLQENGSEALRVHKKRITKPIKKKRTK